MIKVDRCFEHRIHRDFIADCSLCQLAKDDLRSDYEFDRMKELEEENSRLKRMYANLSLVHEALKDAVGKKL